MTPTPPPYRHSPGSDNGNNNDVTMSKTKFTLLCAFCILAGSFGSLVIWDTVLKSLYGIDEQVVIERVSEPAVEQDRPSVVDRMASHYVADSEISFIMNSVTGYVHIPAGRDWVRHYRLRKSRIAPAGPDSVITVSDGTYRFSADVARLREMAGDGARALPVKTVLTDVAGKKETPFHITHMIVKFRDNGLVDAEFEGYLFD